MACQQIDRVLKLSEAEGNNVLENSKSELMDEVIWMNNKLSSSLRNKIQIEFKDLLYYKTDAKPHDPASESFICNKCKAVLVFPL
jgi:hypothetical protein